MKVITVLATFFLGSFAAVCAFVPLQPFHVELKAKDLVTPIFATVTPETSDDATALTDEEEYIVQALWQQSMGNQPVLQEMVINSLAALPPKLVMKLKQSLQSTNEAVKGVAAALDTVLNERLAGGRDVLAKLLAAGEIRKLDAEIGKAFRAGELDTAFFTVLNMNLQDAFASEAESDKEVDSEGASRLSVLRHIATRCQEEVEKNIPPGVALLNKLVRTEQPTIRQNQMQHYLCPQPDVITLPDGQEIPVKEKDQRKVLVPHAELIDAFGGAVKQVRTIEKAGGIDAKAAADMVETFRQIAKEARFVIGNEYGVESKELLDFEEGLQPVFRPDSPESPYIQGE